MAASLRVGDKVVISFREAMTDPETGKKYRGYSESTILAVDEHGVRFTLDNVIHFMPWDLIGGVIINEEGKRTSNIQGF